VRHQRRDRRFLCRIRQPLSARAESDRHRFALAVGRAGAALAPIVSSALFARGLPLSLVALLLFARLPARRADGHNLDMVVADL